MLLQAGCDMNQQDTDGLSVAHWCACQGKHRVSALLLAMSSLALAPLFLCRCSNTSWTWVQNGALLFPGSPHHNPTNRITAHRFVRDRQGQSLLHYACMAPSSKSLLVVLKRVQAVAPDAVDWITTDGVTPLVRALHTHVDSGAYMFRVARGKLVRPQQARGAVAQVRGGCWDPGSGGKDVSALCC